MAFKEMQSLSSEVTISLGGYNKKLKKENPTQVQGYYLGTRMVPSKLSQTGEAALHFLQTDRGNVGVWGKSDLDRKLTQVTPGTMVRVTQTGTRPTNKGNEAYVYKVELDSENTIDVGGIETQCSTEEDPNSDFNYTDTHEEEEDRFPVKNAAPATPAAAPDLAHQKRVHDLLNRNKSKSG